MDWKAHLLIGCIFGAVVGASLFGFGVAKLALFCAVSGFCALLPDLDMRKSKSSQLLFAAVSIAALAAIVSYSEGGKRDVFESALFGAILVAGFLLLDMLIRPKHRGLMHGMLFLAIIGIGAYFALGWFFAVALAIGYVSHLLADMCVKAW